MPVSPKCNVKPVMLLISKYLAKIDKKKVTVLDLGIGRGDYGKYMADCVPDVKKVLTGVEIWERYRNDQWNQYYETVLITDIKQFLRNNTSRYDIILFLDVIEHFNKQDGKIILKMLKNISDLIIVSMPIGPYTQGEYKGNLHETHRSIWNSKDLKENNLIKISEKRVFRPYALLIGKLNEVFPKFGVYYYSKANLKNILNLRTQKI